MVLTPRGTKVAVLSHVLPPSPSGQSTVLSRLLGNWDLNEYCLLSSRDDSLDHREEGISPEAGRLPAPYYHLSPGIRLPVPRLRVMSVLGTVPNALLGFLWRARQVERILRAETCGTLIACSGDLLDIPSGFMASRRVGAAFYAYMFDDYAYQWTSRLYRWLASRFERVILPRAAGVIAANEFLAAEYRRRCGIEVVVIHNPTEVDLGAAQPQETTGTGETRIVYTGSVYHAHSDAFRNLQAAMDQIGQPGLRLHLYTSQSRADLEEAGVTGTAVAHPHVPLAEALRLQREGNVLFLPLAFHSPIPEIIRTSAPGKMGEYLASGRPILVHAPADSYVSWYFRKHGCGLVVDQNDARSLADALRELLGNRALRRRLGETALARAKADFSTEAARKAFRELVVASAD